MLPRTRVAFLLALAFAALLACSLESSGVIGSNDAGLDASVDAIVDRAEVDEDAPDVAVDVMADAPPPSPTPPDSLTGLGLWLRADKGVVTADAGSDGATRVAVWQDRSDAGDPGRNAAPSSLLVAPTLVVSNVKYANEPTVHFDDPQSLATGTFAPQIAQPTTILVVGHTSSGGIQDRYLVDSLLPATPFSIYSAGSGEVGAPLDSIQMNAGIGTTNGATSGTSPVIVIATFSGTSSRLYVSSDTPKSVTPGNNGAGGLTIGNWAGGGPFSAKGDIAEVAVWSRSLSTSEVVGLNLYCSKRYGITLK